MAVMLEPLVGLSQPHWHLTYPLQQMQQTGTGGRLWQRAQSGKEHMQGLARGLVCRRTAAAYNQDLLSPFLSLSLFSSLLLFLSGHIPLHANPLLDCSMMEEGGGQAALHFRPRGPDRCRGCITAVSGEYRQQVQEFGPVLGRQQMSCSKGIIDTVQYIEVRCRVEHCT
ncbi:hypothetical protein BCV69DRAFT_40079 [Microstroma glucosiphilum]|uniref:Uncharacterized protein n=1 Tax=Pseudomicrostroma glucosiphilum TaxID=1684307 RepID=A0A316U548_9BASI|nr:hypothetical protein BCV69DRAFT_40079 [Pseudomicrostroma glucosiphilum]PWN19453.1 hypothetical protein BCV69DRAFT_40079 [Pseudomicrostroma glucosiphilum]